MPPCSISRFVLAEPGGGAGNQEHSTASLPPLPSTCTRMTVGGSLHLPYSSSLHKWRGLVWSDPVAITSSVIAVWILWVSGLGFCLCYEGHLSTT